MNEELIESGIKDQPTLSGSEDDLRDLSPSRQKLVEELKDARTLQQQAKKEKEGGYEAPEEEEEGKGEGEAKKKHKKDKKPKKTEEEVRAEREREKEMDKRKKKEQFQ